MKTIRGWMSLVAVVALVGCAGVQNSGKPAVSESKDALDGKAEAWSSADRPTLFNSTLEDRIAQLPQSGEATNIPWASNYWPTYMDNINHRWDGANSDSAAAKYAKAFGLDPKVVEDAVSANHGIDNYKSRTACTQSSECNSKIGESCAKRQGQESGYCIPTWWGICHAWSPVSILHPEPKHPVTKNGVTFKINDIKALLTLVHNRTSSKFVSRRCYTDASSEEGLGTDEFDRPEGQECRDTNPGTWHILMTNYLGVRKEAFVYDRTYDDEVWNQPLRGYQVTEQREVTSREANELIGVTTVGGTTVDKSGTVTKGQWAHQGSFDVEAGSKVKVVMSGTNDADLYVKFGAQPTASAYDCRPYAGSSNENCDLTVPAGVTRVFVSVNGYSDTADFQLKITTGGGVPTSYQFNPGAVKFYFVKATVKYITESSASTDGNLGSRIDSYTRSDHYEYILEVNAEGRIIGGEWVGSSKKAHPDFLWLPTGVSGTSVAGGKITYARVKEIYDISMQDPNTGGGDREEVTVKEGGTVAKDVWKHFGPFQVAPAANLIATMTGTNDADLYVRKGSAPTTSAYDCRPYASGSSESCTVTGSGAVYVSVRGYAASSDFQLTIVYTTGSGSEPPVEPPATVTHLNETGTVAQGESKVYTVEVPAGYKIKVQTTSSSDVDLYLQMNQAPTTAAYLMRAWTTSGNETLNYTAGSSGVLFIMVHGYAAGSFTLTTTTF